MKTELTTEQSQHLIDLGVPKEKASIVIYSGKEYWDFLSKGIEDCEIPNCCPIFKFEDFLNREILPKVLYKEGLAYAYNLEMCWREEEKKWSVGYDAIGDNMGLFSAPELIDALYELACWYYGEYLKSEKK